MRIKQTLESLGAAPRKSLSQNFLISTHWAEKLATLVTSDSLAEGIWEVGPGLGALTRPLLQRAKVPVRLFEMDRKLAQKLREDLPQISLEEGDFLKCDIASFDPGKKLAFLSNLPYHLSSPILFLLLEHREKFSSLVITFQKEFAERVKAKPRTKAYGALSVLLQLHFDVESAGIIPANAFHPAPKVASMALRFVPRPALNVPYEGLSQLVKTGFAHRRKLLQSNIKPLYSQAKVGAAFEALSLPPKARPEELSPEQWLALHKALVIERPL